MSAELEIVLAVIGTGVALAALIAAQGAAHRREIADQGAAHRRELAELRQEIGYVRERLARLEGIMDIIRTGMQLPRPEGDAERRSA